MSHTRRQDSSLSPLGRYYFLAFIKVSYKLGRVSTAYAVLERQSTLLKCGIKIIY
jgi:hypothetical protein